ncbi:hypothetical protein [Mesomycoplasma neurolyticum]|uniref:Uncharacterized protein n=1 Tax=Mesomycoplasma neurolyticum TaxID=2120 RepID=A0A449A5F2_9BACT|nr:hypothetical protein [Mesomycoplasma neurolyticum]VEU59459.1 Uncharacterised protein [Mesomycoplasma neurolyticum]
MNFSLKEDLNTKSYNLKNGKYFHSNLIKRLKAFNPDFLLNSEVFILKNEYFNFDSSKIKHFKFEEGYINDFLLHKIGIQKGPYQTLFFV